MEASSQFTELSSGAFGMSWGDFLPFIWQTWTEGGWLMIPLAGLALLIYFEAMAIILRLGRAKIRKTPREIWSKWIEDPANGSGHIGEVIRFVVRDGIRGPDAIMRVEAVKAKILPDINSRIVVLSVLVTIAPLMGLLGTVIGMLTTFRGLATSSAQAVDLVAEGIRVALITTQTGLMIAIPGYIFISMVIRNRNIYLTFLAELETIVVQKVHRKEELS
jgi:biopolymer transport protein ExbB